MFCSSITRLYDGSSEGWKTRCFEMSFPADFYDCRNTCTSRGYPVVECFSKEVKLKLAAFVMVFTEI